MGETEGIRPRFLASFQVKPSLVMLEESDVIYGNLETNFLFHFCLAALNFNRKSLLTI
jgi:hypothetical protein